MGRNLTDLDLWIEARSFRNEISRLTKTFPKEEKFKLSDQILRSSRSITANIAEGYGRFHFQENIQFCRQARGSLVECFDHLTVALDEGYLEKELFDKFILKYEELAKMLNGYISYLNNRKQNG